MKCVNCGNELSDNSKECSNCGYVNGIGQYINKKNVAIAGGSVLAAGLSAVGISKLAKDNNKTSAKENIGSIEKIEENIVVDNITNEENVPEINEDFLIEEIPNEDIENIDIVLPNDTNKDTSKNYKDSLEINDNSKPTKKPISTSNDSNENDKDESEKKEDIIVGDSNKEDDKEEKDEELEESEEENEDEETEESEEENEDEETKESEEENEDEETKESEEENEDEEEFDGYGNVGSGAAPASEPLQPNPIIGNVDFYFNYFCVYDAIKQLSSLSQCSNGDYNLGNISSTIGSIFDNQANNTISYGYKSDKNNTELKSDFDRFNGEDGFLQLLTKSLNNVWTKVTDGMSEEEIQVNIQNGMIENTANYTTTYDEDYLKELMDGGLTESEAKAQISEERRQEYFQELADKGYADSAEAAKTMIGEYSTVAADYAQRAADETQKADYDYTKSLSFRLTKVLTGKSLSESDVIALEQGRLDRVAAGLWVGLENQLFENGLMGDNKTTLEDFSMQQLINGMQDENGYIDPNTKTDEQKYLERVMYGSEIGKTSGANEEVLSLIQGSISQYYDSKKQYYPGDHIYDLLQSGVMAGYFDEQGGVVPFEERYVYNDPENKDIAKVSDAQGYKFINWNVDMYHSIVENRSVEHRLIVNPFEEQFIRTYDYYDVALPNYNNALELVDYDNLLGTGTSDEQIAKALTMIGTVPITESQYTDEEYKKIVENAKVAAEQFVQAGLNLETYYKMWCSEYDGVNPYQEFIGNNINQIISENDDTIFDKETEKLNYDMLFQLFDKVESNCSTKNGSSFMDIYLDMVNNGNYDNYVHKDAKLSIDATYGTKYGDLQTLTYIKNIDENNTEMITFGDELAASLSCGYADKMLFLNNMNSLFDYNTMRLEYANVYGEYLEAKANYEYQRDYIDPYDWTGSENDKSQALKNEQNRHRELVDIASDKFGDAYFNYITDVNSQKELRMEFIELKNSYARSFPDSDTFKLTPDEELFIEEYNIENYNHSEISIIDGYLGEAYEELKDCKTLDDLITNVEIINGYVSEKQNKTLMLMTELEDMNENNYQGVIASCEYSGVDSFSGAPLGLLFRDSQGNEIQPSSEDIAIYMSLNPEDYSEYGLYLSVNERDYTTALMESSEFMRRAISYISVNKPQEDFEGYFKSLVESGNFSLAKQSAAATQAEYERRKGLGDFFLTVEEFIKAGGNQIKYGWVNLVDADGIKNRVDYHNMLVSSYLSEENKFLYHTYNVGTSIVNMVPTMALSLIPVAGPYLGSAFMWATSTGNATEGFMQEGMPKEAAYICGIISGTLEVTLQAILGSKFFGGVKLNFAKDAIKKMVGATVKGTLTTLAYDRVIDALGEGFEEFSQEIIGTWISNIYMGLSGEHKNIKNIINSGNEQEIKELFYRECYEQYMQEVNGKNNPNLADSEITFNTYLSFNNWLLLNQTAINNGTLALIKDGESVDYSDWFKTQNEYSQKGGGLKWYFDNRESIDWGAAIQSGLYGAATSLIMGMPSTGVQTVSYIKTGNTDTYSNFIQNRLSNSNFNIIQNIGGLLNYAKALSSAGITDVNQYTQQIMSDPKFNTMYESYESASQKQDKDTISREEMALQMFTDVFSNMEASEIAGINMDYLRTAMTSASTTKFHLEEVESRIQQLTEEYNNINNNTEMSLEEKRTKLNEIKQELTTLKEGRRNLRQQLKQQKLAVEKEIKNNKAFTDYSEITDAELSTLIEETTKAISAKEEQIQRNNNKIKEQEAIIESTSHGFIASNGKPATKAQKAQITSKAQKAINQLKAENEILEAELSELQSELPQLKINDLLRNPEKGLSSLTDSEFNYFISNATSKMLDLFSDEIIGRLSSVSESNIQALYDKVSVAFTNIYKLELISNLDSVTDETIRNALLENINSRITPEKFYEGILDTYTERYEYLNLIEANTEKPGLITWIKGLVNKAKNSLSKESTENNEAQKIAQRNEMVDRTGTQIDQTIENLEQEIKNLSIANDNLTRNKDNKSKEEIKEEIAKNKERKAKIESEIEQLKSIKKQIAKLTDSTIKLTDLNNEVFNYLVNSMSQENITMFSEEIISKLDILSNETFSNLISNMSIDTIYKYSESLLQRTEKISDKKFKDLKQKVKDNIDKAINDYVTVRTSVEEVTGEDITTKFNIIQLIKNKIDGIKLSREERLAKIEECRSQLKTTTIENINSRITQLNQEIQSIDESNKTSKDKVRKELQRKTKLESEIKSLESIKNEIDKVLGDSKGKISKLSNEAFNYLYENMSQEEIQLFSKDIIKRLETLSNENFKDFVEKIDEETVYDYKSNLITRAAAIIKDPSNRNYITELIESKSNSYKESNIESTTKTTTENIVEAESSTTTEVETKTDEVVEEKSTTETEVNTEESIETKTTEDTNTTTEVVVEIDTSVDTNTDILTTLSPVALQIVEKLKSIKILAPAIEELMQKGSLKQLSSESLNLIIGNLDYNTLNNKDVLNEVIESIDKISNSGVLGIISNLSKENLSTLAPNETNPTVESISKNNKNILTSRINGITSETVRVLTQTVLIQQMITHNLVSPNKTVNQQKMTEMMKNSNTPLESIMDVLNDPSINSTEKIKLLTTVLNNFIKTETKLLGNIEARTKELINSAHDAILKLSPKTQFDILKVKLNNMSSTIKSRLQPVQALIQKISNIPQDIKTKVESIAKAYHVLLEDISSCLSKLTTAEVDSKGKFVVETETESKVETVESNEIEIDIPETVDLESSDASTDTDENQQANNTNQKNIENDGNETTTSVQIKNIDFLSYSNNLPLFESKFSQAVKDWVASIKQEKMFITNYTGEYILAPGNYRSVNGILRGQITKDSTKLLFYGAFGKPPKVYNTIDEFVSMHKGDILTYYNQLFGSNPFNDFSGTETQVIYQAFLAYQTKAAQFIIQGISKFKQPTGNEGIILYREQGINSISKKYGFTIDQSAEEIFKALTTDSNGSKRDHFVFDSFTSSSINDPSNYYKTEKHVFFKIKCDETISFADVMQVSNVGEVEGEILLNAGQHFRIESVEKNSVGNVVITLAPYSTTETVVKATANTVTSSTTANTVTSSTTVIDPVISALNYLSTSDFQSIVNLNLTEAQQEIFFNEAIKNGYYQNVVEMASHFTKAADILIQKGDFSFLKNSDIESKVIYDAILQIGNKYGIKNVNDIINTYISSSKQNALFIDLINQNKGYIVADLATLNVVASRAMMNIGNYTFLTNPKTNINILLDAVNYLKSIGKLDVFSGIQVNNPLFAYNLFKNGVNFNYSNDTNFKKHFYNLLMNNIILNQGNKFLANKAIALINSMGYQNNIIKISNMDQLLGAITNNFSSFVIDSTFAQDAIEIIKGVICQESLQNAISIVNSFVVNNSQYLSDLFNSNIPIDLKIKLLGNLENSIVSTIKFDLSTTTAIYNYLSDTTFDKVDCCNLLGLNSTDSSNHFLAVKQIAELSKTNARELILIFKNNVPGSYQYIEAINMLKQNNQSYANMSAEEIVKEVIVNYGRAQIKLYDIGIDRIHTITYNSININIYCANPNNFSTALTRVKHIINIIDSLPAVLRFTITELNVYDTNNPFDEYWACEYDKDINSGFYSAATGGFGQVNIWNYMPQIDTIAHELGHCLDSGIYKHIYGNEGYITKIKPEWSNAIAADGNSISSYGNKAIVEDFAESVKLYITNPTEFFKYYRNRAKVLMNMFNQYLEKELGINSKMTKSQINNRLIEVGLDNDIIKTYIAQGYTIYDIKNAWFRILITNESFESAIIAIRSNNNANGFI